MPIGRAETAGGGFRWHGAQSDVSSGSGEAACVDADRDGLEGDGDLGTGGKDSSGSDFSRGRSKAGAAGGRWVSGAPYETGGMGGVRRVAGAGAGATVAAGATAARAARKALTLNAG